MRAVTIVASVFAISLASASPIFAQAPQSTMGSSKSTSHSTMPGASTHSQGFKSESEAKAACGSQKVVWANTSSHVLHSSSSKYYGKTKHGAYMCESTATQAGYHMAKGE